MAGARDSRGRFTKKGSRDSLVWRSDTLTPGLRRLPAEISRAVAATVEYHAPLAENYMKTNAPWEDQTTNARNGLKAVPVHIGDRHAIVVHHSMDYGFWLEVKQQGKFGIIPATIQSQGRAVMTTLRGLFKRMRSSRR